MRISVIGTGYVGLVSGTCFSEMGNIVTCVDIDKDKINKLNQGVIPIYEPGLDSLIQSNLKNKNLFFSSNIEESIKTSTIIFIAVGTPMSDDGSADLKYVYEVARVIGSSIDKNVVVVNK